MLFGLYVQLKREELTLSCIQQFYMIADPDAAPAAAAAPPAAAAAAAAAAAGGGLSWDCLEGLGGEVPSYISLSSPLQQRGGVSRERLQRIFQEKYKHLKTLYEALAVGQSVIFVNSRRLAFFLALKLQKELSFSVSLICGKHIYIIYI